MPRSALLSGRVAPRDRAQQRTKLDRRRAARAEHALDPDEQMDAWLEEHIAGASTEALATLDLGAFVAATTHVDLPPAERLRLLAVYVEPGLLAEASPRAFDTHDRIYAAAIAIDPRDLSVLSSRAVSAHAHAENLLSSTDTREAWVASRPRRRWMRIAKESVDAGLRLEPESAALLYRAGQLRYDDPDDAPQHALPYFDRALAVDRHHGGAALYRAHCLHDLEAWRDAAEAYDAVPRTFFVRTRAWRLEVLLEQCAWCWLRAGERDEARMRWLALLDRWEADPALAREALGRHLADAATGELRAELYERARALAAREDARRAQEAPRGGLDGLSVRALDDAERRAASRG